MMTGWDHFIMDHAVMAQRKSKDPSTKVGAAISTPRHQVICTGYNGYPRGVVDVSLHNRDYKYPRTVHAELNALLTALDVGAKVRGCYIYTTRFPCARCCGPIIQAGLVKVVYIEDLEFEARWQDEMDVSRDMFQQAGVSVIRYEPN